MRSEVAAAALAAGATIVNDVSGGLADPRILEVVAGAAPEVRYVAMHWRAHSDRMQEFTTYDGPVAAVVADELRARVDAIRAAGIADDRIVLDPGIGLREDRRPELGAARPDRARPGARVPVAGRCQPQALPRRAPGRP